MKSIASLLILSFSVFTSNAQHESFDIATYTVPIGWKKISNSNDVVGYAITNNKKGTYCQIAIYKSMGTMGSAQLDFDTDWNDLIRKPYGIASNPEPGMPKSEDGWEVRSGVAPFDFNGGKSIAILVTMSGYSTRLSISILTNTQDYQKDVDKFIESADLKKPMVIPQTNQVTNSPSIIGSWGKSNSVGQVNNRFGTYSYVKYQYTFNSNGTYSFTGKNYSEQYDETLLIKENGTYLINETQLTVIPQNSVIEAWSKKNGGDNWNLLKTSKRRTLEKTTYQIAIVERNLLLTTDAETERDGLFSNGNSYSYGPPGTFTAIQLPEVEVTQTQSQKTEPLSVASDTRFKFTSTDFDDTWVSTIHEDWVKVTKGETSVLLHYVTNRIDLSSADYATIGQNAWNTLIAARYRNMENYFQFRGSADYERPYFISADLVDNLSGKRSHVVLFKRGSSAWIEVISPSKSSFVNTFGIDINTVDYYTDSKIWEPLQKMVGYNRFAVGGSDLKGKWTNNFSGMTQYINVYTGADAGMNTHSSIELFEFIGSSYTWELKVARGMVGNIKFQGVKSSGTFSMVSNWQVKFSDIEGKPRTYNAYFSCVKGARILWLEDSAYATSYTGYGKSD